MSLDDKNNYKAASQTRPSLNLRLGQRLPPTAPEHRGQCAAATSNKGTEFSSNRHHHPVSPRETHNPCTTFSTEIDPPVEPRALAPSNPTTSCADSDMDRDLPEAACSSIEADFQQLTSPDTDHRFQSAETVDVAPCGERTVSSSMSDERMSESRDAGGIAHGDRAIEEQSRSPAVSAENVQPFPTASHVQYLERLAGRPRTLERRRTIFASLTDIQTNIEIVLKNMPANDDIQECLKSLHRHQCGFEVQLERDLESIQAPWKEIVECLARPLQMTPLRPSHRNIRQGAHIILVVLVFVLYHYTVLPSGSVQPRRVFNALVDLLPAISAVSFAYFLASVLISWWQYSRLSTAEEERMASEGLHGIPLLLCILNLTKAYAKVEEDAKLRSCRVDVTPISSLETVCKSLQESLAI